MKLTVTEIAVHRDNESFAFGETTTYVKLIDEGSGSLISITQHVGSTVNEIRLDFNEIEYVLAAINRLKAEIQ